MFYMAGVGGICIKDFILSLTQVHCHLGCVLRRGYLDPDTVFSFWAHEVGNHILPTSDSCHNSLQLHPQLQAQRPRTKALALTQDKLPLL